MTDLNALNKYLTGKGSPLTISASDVNLQPEFQAFMATVPGKQVTLAPGAGGIGLKNDLLTITGTSSDVWPVQGLTNVQLTLSVISITISTAGGKTVFTGVAQAQMPFSKTVSVPVVVTALEQEKNPWQITLAQNAANLTPLQIILLGSNSGQLPFDIPAGMDFLNAGLTADKKAYDILFYPNTEFDAYTQFTLNAPAASWTPVEGIFAFKGLDIIGVLTTDSVAVTLLGHLLIGSVGVDAGITMTTGDDWTVFTKPTPPAETFPGLAALAQWIGGNTLDTEVNTGFSSTKIETGGFDVAISNITASINIKKFSLNFLNITSLLTIGALKLDVVVQLPTLLIHGGLHDGVGLHITDLLDSFNLPSSAVPSKLTLARADFTADLKNSLYSIDMEVDNVWSAGPLNFEQINLALNYNSIEGVTGSFGCRFGIANTAEILLLAEYGGSEQGWMFSGGLNPETTLKMSDVIALLTGDFGIGSVPEPIQSLEITTLMITYATATSAFSFTCAGHFTVDDTDVKMEVVVKLDKGKSNDPLKDGQVNGTKGYNAFFSGNVTINDLVFDVVFDTSSTGTNVFIAAYHHTGSGSTSLHSLVAAVSTTLAEVIPPSLMIDLKEVKFIFFEQNKVKQFAFGLDIDISMNLQDLPVIGKKIPDGMTLTVNDLQVLYASAIFTPAQAVVINPLLPKGILPLNADGLGKGLMISGVLDVAGHQWPVNTGSKPAPAASTSIPFTGAAAPAAAPAASASPSPITWFNVNKQVGPLTFERIGVEYEDGVLSLALDASLKLGPASLSMMGLTAGSPLSKFAPVFGLQGFTFDIHSGGLEVGGAFLKVVDEKKVTSYYGEVIVKIGPLGIKALGGDTPAHEADDPHNPGKKIQIPESFFIYANITAPLGGPPFLYLNGFAGGFGINNLLKLPTLENLPGYILLPGPGSKAPAQGSTPADTIKAVLPQMQQYFVPTTGQYWFAAGIAFSSFQMINAFALVTVSFGVEFQIALLGTASMSFPMGAPEPIAYVEIDILASYSTATGLMAVEGILSPASFLFGSFCQLTGGFAFYIWLNPPVTASGPRKGDFVVTLGGYHPAYQPPVYFPKVPRLGINFNLGPFHVVGGSYFALTSGMFMAGCSLKASFDTSIVKVWFNVGADFLIAWAPFHYEADVYVSLGCSVNLGLFTLSISVGADLYLWGPPFGGRADVDLAIVSFTIFFGADRIPPPPIGWSDFKEKFLPANNQTQQAAPRMLMAFAESATVAADNVTNILKSTIESGLNGTNVSGFDWILDPDHFSIVVNSTVPVNNPQWTISNGVFHPITDKLKTDYNQNPLDSDKWPFQIFNGSNNFTDTQVWNPTVNIKPMSLNGVSSTLTISLMRANESGVFNEFVKAVSIEPTILNSAAALWAPDSGEKLKTTDPTFLLSCLTGFKITPLPRIPNTVNAVLLIQLLFQQGNHYYFNYQLPVIDTSFKVKVTGRSTSTLTIDITGNHTGSLKNENYVLSGLADTWVAGQRSAVLANLNSIGFNTYSEVNLATFASKTMLTNWPQVMILGNSLVVKK
jgi:hypothetical protein